MAQRKPFLLRIDPGLWDDLEAWAQAELRSVNGQIEWLLKQAIDKRRRSMTQPPLSVGKPTPAPKPGKSGSGN